MLEALVATLRLVCFVFAKGVSSFH